MPEGAERIAVIGGTGAEGGALALRWAAAGFPITIGSRDAGRAVEAARRIAAVLGGHAAVDGAENAAAAAGAAIVVLTVPFAAQAATLKAVREALRPGQVLVDCTVPLATAVGGRPTRLLGVWEGSAAEQAAALVPAGVAVTSAFHHVAAESLRDLGQPVDSDVLVCGDDSAAKQRVRRLVESIEGCRYVDAGPLSMARIVESMCALLIGLNLRYKVHRAGIRITGLPSHAR